MNRMSFPAAVLWNDGMLEVWREADRYSEGDGGIFIHQTTGSCLGAG